ncbi:MAG: glycosyltransferase family 2 protein [Nitrososphaerales archaeon]
MPAYNEEKNIERVIEELIKILKQTGLKYEIIVVNDGSKDNTAKKVLGCAEKYGFIKVLSYNENKGKGYAIKEGFKHASGNIVFLLDAGGEILPINLKEYFNALKYVDIAIGSKWHERSKIQSPFFRKFLSRGFCVLVKLFISINVSDTQTGFKAFRRKALEKLVRMQSMNRYVYDVEFLAIANLLKLKVLELPVHIRLNDDFSIKNILQMFYEFLVLVYRFRIKKNYQNTLLRSKSTILEFTDKFF